jgi:hypothetical protein
MERLKRADTKGDGANGAPAGREQGNMAANELTPEQPNGSEHTYEKDVEVLLRESKRLRKENAKLCEAVDAHLANCRVSYRDRATRCGRVYDVLEEIGVPQRDAVRIVEQVDDSLLRVGS